tara:strand:+ start:48 stop:395 length:348 start_codon:yes stop_codon:yes gene_type:complete
MSIPITPSPLQQGLDEIERLKEALEIQHEIHQQNTRNSLEDFEIVLTVRIPESSVEYVFTSIEEGMEFDTEAGEGIRHYDVRKVALKDDDDDDDEPDLSTMAGRRAKWLAMGGEE